MVWLDLAGNDGNALYFVADRVEPSHFRSDGIVVSGIIGDGLYEGPVAIEIGAESEVAFFDEWMAVSDFREFERQVDLQAVKAALLETAARIVAYMRGDGFLQAPEHSMRSGRGPVVRGAQPSIGRTAA